jgi:hypothetical protein
VQRRGKAPGPSSQPDRQSSEGTGRCCRGGHERRSARLPRGEAIAILGRDRVEARGGVRAYGLVETERYRFRVVAPSGRFRQAWMRDESNSEENAQAAEPTFDE